MPKLVVRPAELRDVDELIKLMNEAVQYKIAHGDYAWALVPYTPHKLRSKIKRGGVYTAWVGGALVGTVQLSTHDDLIWGPQPPTAAYVHQLAIKDGYHGQNLGRQLLAWAGDRAVQKGYELLRIDVPAGNAGLKNYYEQLGFLQVKQTRVHAPGGAYAACLYERPATWQP